MTLRLPLVGVLKSRRSKPHPKSSSRAAEPPPPRLNCRLLPEKLVDRGGRGHTIMAFTARTDKKVGLERPRASVTVRNRGRRATKGKTAMRHLMTRGRGFAAWWFRENPLSDRPTATVVGQEFPTTDPPALWSSVGVCAPAGGSGAIFCAILVSPKRWEATVIARDTGQWACPESPKRPSASPRARARVGRDRSACLCAARNLGTHGSP